MLHNDSGFVKRPTAIRKVVMGPDGTSQIIYVDPKTGQQVSNIDGYHIAQARDNAGNLSLGNGPNGTPHNAQPDKAPTLTDTAMGIERRGERAPSLDAVNPGLDKASYINKPAVMGFAGMLPGPLGMLGTIANVGINANNNAAVNNQRETLGFAPKTAMQNVGGVLSDKHGYIGDAAYEDGQGKEHVTPVSFESEDAAGRTTLTPDEARMRNELNPSFEEATKAQTEESIQEAKAAGYNKGLLSSIGSAAHSIFSGLFGTSTTGSTPSNSYPTAPSAPQGDAPGLPGGGGAVHNVDSTTPGGIRDGGFHSGTPQGNVPSGPGLY